MMIARLARRKAGGADDGKPAVHDFNDYTVVFIDYTMVFNSTRWYSMIVPR